MLRKMHKNQSGVTLIELLIVMIIIAILSVVIFVSMTASIEDAEQASLDDMRDKVHATLEHWVSKRVTDNASLSEGIADGLSAAVVGIADFVLQMEAGDGEIEETAD